MRALGLLLIIANLAYLGWATLIDVRDEPLPASTAANDVSVQRLVLATERTRATAAAAARSQSARQERSVNQSTSTDPSRTGGSTASRAAPTTEGVPQKTGPQCISIGPFQDLTSAAQASAKLKTEGRDSRQRLEQGQLWVGYWVSVPGFAKREDAERAVARLKQNGITDAYISLSGADAESSNIVSLGVFKDSERAQRLLAEAKGLGFPAQVSDRTRAGSVYWIDVDFPAPQPDFDFSSLGAQPGKILRLEQRSCPGTH
jgi:cell division septation protein DedD